jgi:sugar lactone lactonase YvrE
VDVEGAYWTCANDGGQVHRFLPDGQLDCSIPLPISKPSMCSFGGPEMDHLLITSISPAKPANGFDAALDGAVFVVRPGVRGIAETPFQF